MGIRRIENTDPAFEQFLKLPELIYRDDPYHRARPIEETRVLLDQAENPCWKSARRALFILEREGQISGRIAAIQDPGIKRQHANNEGFFGFFECIDDQDAALGLFDAASRWLVEQGGCTAVRGPCSPLPDFFNFGILVEGFDQPQVTGEAYNPAYYPALIEGCGFEKAADYLSFRNHFPDNQVFENMMNRLERILGKHKRTSVRSFDVRNFDRDAAIVNDVINRSFESGVFYSITDLETQKFMLKRTAPLNEMEWFMIQEERGEPVGVNLEAPNYDELLWGDTIRGVRSENFAVLPEYHGTFAASILFYHGWEKARRLGFEDLYCSYASEKHTAMHGIAQSFGCKVTKRHRVYCKHL